MINEDLCGFFQGIFRIDRTIGVDFDDQLLIVGLLFDTPVFHLVAHIADGRIDGVDGDGVDRGAGHFVLVGRHIASALIDVELDIELHRRLKVANDEIGVEHLEGAEILVDVASLELLLAGDSKADLLVDFSGDHLFEAHLFEIQHHISDVFNNAVDGSKLVGDTVDVDRSDSKAFK